MTQDEYKRWQEHNIQVMKLGGTLSTNFMIDGTIEEWRTVNGQCVRNDPERQTELSLI